MCISSPLGSSNWHIRSWIANYWGREVKLGLGSWEHIRHRVIPSLNKHWASALPWLLVWYCTHRDQEGLAMPVKRLSTGMPSPSTGMPSGDRYSGTTHHTVIEPLLSYLQNRWGLTNGGAIFNPGQSFLNIWTHIIIWTSKTKRLVDDPS